MASISSRILRAPMSAQMAEPAAPAMISAAAIGAASLTVASTAVAPANDSAPSCPVRLPTWSAMTAPNGIDTRMVGNIVTLRDEPGLLHELAALEAGRERQPGDVPGHGGNLARAANDRCKAQAHVSSCGPSTPV